VAEQAISLHKELDVHRVISYRVWKSPRSRAKVAAQEINPAFRKKGSASRLLDIRFFAGI
jgi:hypothetical protein